MDNRQLAYKNLITIAEKQGYVTFDDIMDCADEYSLPIQDFDWLSNSVTTRGIIVYNETPSANPSDDEADDYAQSDYDLIYERIISLCPSLDRFVSFVRSVTPPQRGEVTQLKYQVIDGNFYARNRMIEMHLRLALRLSLQRAETYDADIENTLSDACVGLIIAVDKYDPDTSGAFAPYASLWILQNISREQPTQRPLVYYPAHRKEGYFAVYPILKALGCIGCDKLKLCTKAQKTVQEKINCDEVVAKTILEQMIPDECLEDLLSEYTDETNRPYSNDLATSIVLSSLSTETVVSDDDAYVSLYYKQLKEDVSEALNTLTPREAKVIQLRYGFSGSEMTLEEVGKVFNVTRERIRQIEAKALRKLRHPSRAKRLKDYYLAE